VRTVIGIDLSLTGLGLVAVPDDCAWGPDFDWSCVLHRTLTTDKGAPLVDRMGALGADVATWVRWVGKKRGGELVCVHEGYPVGGRVYNLDKLAELGGTVKHMLRSYLGLLVAQAPQSAARKLLLGKLPQRGRKAAVIEVVRAMLPNGGAGWTDDECDAFVAANWMLGELGCRVLTIGVAA